MWLQSSFINEVERVVQSQFTQWILNIGDGKIDARFFKMYSYLSVLYILNIAIFTF